MNTDKGKKVDLLFEDLTYKIIGAAIEVHKVLGPGYLESVYEDALCYELEVLNISPAMRDGFGCQVQAPTSRGSRGDLGLISWWKRKSLLKTKQSQHSPPAMKRSCSTN